MKLFLKYFLCIFILILPACDIGDDSDEEMLTAKESNLPTSAKLKVKQLKQIITLNRKLSKEAEEIIRATKALTIAETDDAIVVRNEIDAARYQAQKDAYLKTIASCERQISDIAK